MVLFLVFPVLVILSVSEESLKMFLLVLRSFRLLCADKPGDTKVYSFGKLKFSSSLSTLLFRVDVASNAPISRCYQDDREGTCTG